MTDEWEIDDWCPKCGNHMNISPCQHCVENNPAICRHGLYYAKCKQDACLNELYEAERAAYCPHGFLTGCPKCELDLEIMVVKEQLDDLYDKLLIDNNYWEEFKKVRNKYQQLSLRRHDYVK